jgi:hypothetical protein
MIAFEVFINGRKKCTAGISGPGVLTATMSWILREPGERRGKRKELNLGIGGLAGRNRFLEWLSYKPKPGDEVTIRIVKATKVDKPKTSRMKLATPAKIKLRKQAHVRRLAKELGWKIQTS